MDSNLKQTLSHGHLIELVRVYAPNISDRGVCNGVTSMWLQAVITNKDQEAVFYKRLDFLSKYLSDSNNSIQKLVAEIQEIYDTQQSTKEMRPQRKALSEEELEKLDLRAFAESVAIQQDVNVLGVFPKYMPHADRETRYPITASKMLDESATKVKHNQVGVLALNRTDLKKYLESIKSILEKDRKLHPDKRGGFLLNSDNHTVGMYLDAESGKWHFFDINHLTNKTEYYFSEDSSRLPYNIFRSFFDGASLNSVFSAQYVSTYHDDSLVSSLNKVSDEFSDGGLHLKNSRGYTLLHAAAYIGDVDRVNDLLKKGADTNAMSTGEGYNYTPLKLAIANGRIEVVKAFLLAEPKLASETVINAIMYAANIGRVEMLDLLFGFDPSLGIDVKDEFEKTALMWAIEAGQIKVIEKLLSATPKADVNAVAEGGWTPIMFAIFFNQIDILKRLLAETPKANVNAMTVDGKTPLMFAAVYGRTEALKILLAEKDPKVEINLKNSEQDTALILAAGFGHSDIVEILLNADPKADIESRALYGKTALMVAAERGKVDSIKALLAASPKADVNAIGDEGWTALMYAVENNQVDTLEFLLTVDNPKVDLRAVNQEGETALMLAAKYGLLEMVQKLYAADPNPIKGKLALEIAAENNQGSVIHFLQNALKITLPKFSPLILAAEFGDYSEIAELLAADPKPDIEARNEDGKTALSVAVKMGRLPIIGYLLQRADPKADIETRDDEDKTPLMIAAKHGQLGSIKVLLSFNQKANVNAVTKTGWTPIMYAIQGGHLPTLKLLLEMEPTIDLNIMNNQGETALMIAAEMGSMEMVEALIKADPNIGKIMLASIIAAQKGHKDISQLLDKTHNEREAALKASSPSQSQTEPQSPIALSPNKAFLPSVTPAIPTMPATPKAAVDLTTQKDSSKDSNNNAASTPKKTI